MSTEKVTTPTTTYHSLSPSIKWYKNSNFCLIFKRSCWKRKRRNFYPFKYNNFFTVYELDRWSRDLNSDFTFKDCLFLGVRLAKNADSNKYVYAGYGIGFNLRSEFSLPDSSTGKNVIIFGVDMSSSVHIANTNKKKL